MGQNLHLVATATGGELHHCSTLRNYRLFAIKGFGYFSVDHIAFSILMVIDIHWFHAVPNEPHVPLVSCWWLWRPRTLPVFAGEERSILLRRMCACVCMGLLRRRFRTACNSLGANYWVLNLQLDTSIYSSFCVLIRRWCFD